MDLQQYIRVEQTRALYRGVNGVIAGHLGVSFLTVYVLWDAFSQQNLIIWLSVSVFTILLRWLSTRSISADKIDQHNYVPRLRRAVFWSGVSGTIWGLVAVLFFDNSAPTYVLFIICIYAGYTSASMSANSSYLPAFVAFAVPSTLMFSARMFSQVDTNYIPLGIILLFYALMMIVFARREESFFKQSRELNFKNTELMSEVVRQKETAEHAVLAKNQFLASASHDLRQPLHALNLFVDALEPLQNNDKGLGIISKIRQSMRGLNSMLHGLLDISRLDTSTISNKPQHHSLNKTVEQLCEEYRGSRQQVEIVNALDASLSVLADPTLLQRIIRNLLDNAVKYTERGQVLISATQNADQVVLQVKDTGIGIPADQQDKVFDEFQQLNNPERNRQKGLGLGLAIVKRLCTLTEIDINLSSEVGVGTVIGLTIPIGRGDELEEVQSHNEIVGTDLNVVVIDDEQDILDGMQQIFDAWNCSVVTAENVDQAIQSLHQLDWLPDVLVVDFRLRDNQTGLDAIEKLREEFNREFPAILVTGDTAPNRIIEAHESGISILYKPVESRVLWNEIQRIVSAT